MINACNEFYCDAFSPNKPYKPKMWTEAWSGCFKKASNVQDGGSWVSSGGVNLESGGNADVAVTKVDYMTMRHGFINAHFGPNSKFNFHKYIKRSMEDDFMVVVGIGLLISSSIQTLPH
ncbi:hypothetical protein POM88_044210 [Heracleum sosnowskyi]|uniref:Uncharacterized protein n=1 Tax=Heracleum sosnowskyi TaxID=360622 RepID=A0AAD8H3D1_9APIA|nr:hypothetical protein POM88_044210 [Heracleum sosnowskyi]